MFSSSDEVHDVSISWNYILLSVTYNFGSGNWANIERNDSKPLCVKTLLVDRGVYVSEHSESVKQYARIVWASLISSLEVSGYDCLLHRFSPTFQPPLFSVENLKKKSSTRVWTFSLLAALVSVFTIVLWLEINDVFLKFFLWFNSITSAVTACNVGVFKKTWANTWISLLHHRNQFQTSIKFPL